MVCANKTMADGQALSKCRQVFQKGDNSSFHASGCVTVGGRPPGCDVPLSNPGHVSGTHLPSSSWQSRNRQAQHESSWATATVPLCTGLLFSSKGKLQRGFKRPAGLKFEVRNSCLGEQKHKQTNQSVCCSIIHSSIVVCVGGYGKLMAHFQNSFWPSESNPTLS